MQRTQRGDEQAKNNTTKITTWWRLLRWEASRARSINGASANWSNWSEAQEELEHYKFITQKCKTDWKAIIDLASQDSLNSTSQARLQALQSSFTLVLSCDYQMTKLIPFRGSTAQLAIITYYWSPMTCLGSLITAVNKRLSLCLMSVLGPKISTTPCHFLHTTSSTVVSFHTGWSECHG